MKTLMCNVGSTDKKIRITVGLIIFFTFFAMKSWLWLGGVAILVSGLLDFCPLYLIFGFNTTKVPRKWWQ